MPLGSAGPDLIEDKGSPHQLLLKYATACPACPPPGTGGECSGGMLWARVRQVQVSCEARVTVGATGAGVLDAEGRLEAEMM